MGVFAFSLFHSQRLACRGGASQRVCGGGNEQSPLAPAPSFASGFQEPGKDPGIPPPLLLPSYNTTQKGEGTQESKSSALSSLIDWDCTLVPWFSAPHSS